MTTSFSSKPHYPVLDGLRGVAALIVVAFHIFEPHATSGYDQFINHGYLAVDFFFVLSGFVIGYAYDDRWHTLTVGSFFNRRLQRLQPMVVMGMLIGAALFYFADSPKWPMIHTVPVWKVIGIMLIGFTLIPVPPSMDIRGWQEMHPLNGPGWSLFYEYVANILYGIGLRKLSKAALSMLVILTGVFLVYYAVTSEGGDLMGGWSLDALQLKIGFTRLLYPFFSGLLLSRVIKPGHFKHGFLMSSLLIVVILFMPRIGDREHTWQNGLYESLSIIAIFPLIVYIGAGSQMKSVTESRICKFVGDLSYPVYITHFPFIYMYSAWVSKNPSAPLSMQIIYGLLTFLVAIVVGYVSLKYYDEPVRAWLKKRFNG